MTNSLRKCLALAAFATATTSFVGAANAAVTVTIDQIIGEWTSVSGSPSSLSGLNTPSVPGPSPDTPAEIRWGNPSPAGGQQSGYSFRPEDTPLPPGAPPGFDVNDVFTLGEFTHFNFPIQAGTSITGATLEVTISGTVSNAAPDESFMLTSVFDFDHDETPNTGAGCCDDIVTPTLNLGSSESIGFGGTQYIFSTTGFNIGASFNTAENSANQADLLGTFIVAPGQADVPVPATFALLGAGLIGVGLAARRRLTQAG